MFSKRDYPILNELMLIQNYIILHYEKFIRTNWNVLIFKYCINTRIRYIEIRTFSRDLEGYLWNYLSFGQSV